MLSGLHLSNFGEPSLYAIRAPEEIRLPCLDALALGKGKLKGFHTHERNFSGNGSMRRTKGNSDTK